MEPSEAILQPGTPIRPVADFTDVQNIAERYFGLKVTEIIELNGYDDKNYHILVEDKCWDNIYINKVLERGYVLKIINSMDSMNDQFFDGQNSLLSYLAQKGISCPKPILTKRNSFTAKVNLSSGTHIVRLLEYINGKILHHVPCDSHLFYQVGQYAAKIDLALKNFRHPAYANHKNVWMLEAVPDLKKFLFAIKNDANKELVETIINEFANKVLSITNGLEKGIIHGDLNEQNILVTKENNKKWTLKAIIDFGDSNYACFLYELAISMTYMIIQSKDIDAGGYVLAGYNSVRTVPDLEISLLRVCIAARLCQSLVLGAYSNLQDPNNTYVLTTQKQGWILLKEIWAESEDRILQRWLGVAEKYKIN